VINQKARKQAGFTLIEVLVASAILMMSIGVLLQLFGSGLDRIKRAGEEAHLLTAKRVIGHTLDAINPAEVPEGSGVAEGLKFHWKATVAEPFQRIRDEHAYLHYDLALFSIAVDIQRVGGKHHQFVYQRIGRRQAK